MLDVEFLLRPAISSKAVVYAFRSGVLRGAVKVALRALAESRNLLITGLDPAEFGSRRPTPIFPAMFFIDCLGATRATTEQCLRSAEKFVVTADQHLAVFADITFVPPPLMKLIAESCDYIEEASLIEKHVYPIVAYGLRASRPDNINNVGVEKLVAPLKTMVADGSFESLSDLLDDLAKGEAELGRIGMRLRSKGHLSPPLARLVRYRDRLAMIELLRRIDFKVQMGLDEHTVLNAVYRATTSVLRQSIELAKRSSNNQVTRGSRALAGEPLIWSALLLVSTRDAHFDSRRPSRIGSTLLRVHAVAEEFLRRSGVEVSLQPIDGLWQRLSNVFSETMDTVSTTSCERAVLIETFIKAASRSPTKQYDWSRQLRHLVASALISKRAHRAPVQRSPSMLLPQSLNDLEDQPGLLNALRERFLVQDHSAPILLHGLEGIGKRTIARTYAKALLCEGESIQTGDVCGVCSSCLNVDGGFGLIQVDATMSDVSHYIKRYIREIFTTPFGRHRVFIISNVDLSISTIDELLLTLEAVPKSTTFILCARSLELVSAAARSRCDVFRIRRMSPHRSRDLAEGALSIGVQKTTNDVIDTIVAFSKGIPAVILECCRTLNFANVYTLDAARKLLGYGPLDWAETYWRLLFSDPEMARIRLLPSQFSIEEITDAVKLVLTSLAFLIASNGLRSKPDSFELGALADMVEALEDRCTSIEREPNTVLSELSHCWLAGVTGNATNFWIADAACRNILLATRAL